MVKSKPQAFSWTQPACEECYDAIKLKTGHKKESDQQNCCYCREAIPGGQIPFIRVNPGTVPYPTIRKDEDGNS